MEIEEKDEIPEHIIEKSKELGLFGLSIPEEYGGLGLDMVGKCAIFEELGKTHNGFTTLIGSITGSVPSVLWSWEMNIKNENICQKWPAANGLAPLP